MLAAEWSTDLGFAARGFSALASAAQREVSARASESATKRASWPNARTSSTPETISANAASSGDFVTESSRLSSRAATRSGYASCAAPSCLPSRACFETQGGATRGPHKYMLAEQARVGRVRLHAGIDGVLDGRLDLVLVQVGLDLLL